MRCTLIPACALAITIVTAGSAAGQDSSLTYAGAIAAGRAASAELAAAQAALDAARARARQSGAYSNPVPSYNREQAGSGGATTSQDVIAVEQVVENPGVRSARRDAMRFRVIAAEARVRSVEAGVDFEVTRAYAHSVASARRAELAEQARRAFAAALTVTERRLREGDISGLQARRVRLEAARYAALRGEAMLASRTARLAFAMLTGVPMDSTATLSAPALTDAALLPADSLIPLALLSRGDLMVASAEVDVMRAEARVAERERLPHATLTLGSKREEPIAGERLNGFVAGVALPLPLWDRRGAATQASVADARREYAEWAGLRRRIAREVTEASDALQSAQEQLDAIGPALQADAATALQSAQVAYTEGELTLLEWLDTARAYYETETAIANLRAEVLIRAASLGRAVGVNMIRELR